MLRILIGILFILHGLVHMLYFGHSRRAFELSTGLAWPDTAWIFSRMRASGTETIRVLAGAGCILAAAGFVAGGAVLLGKMDIWRPIVVTAAAVSSVLFFLLWDGTFRRMHDQGWVGILINGVTVLSILVLGIPSTP